MSDDRPRSAGKDGKQIKTNRSHEAAHDWATSLGTTPERLRDAIRAVGDPKKVREYLHRR
jgi:hypothetical protein